MSRYGTTTTTRLHGEITKHSPKKSQTSSSQGLLQPKNRLPFMSKVGPFASLATMPARANWPDPEPERYSSPEPKPISSAELRISPPSQTISEREQEVFPARLVVAVLPKPATDKSMHEKRTIRIDPGVYDAVERELKRQKRSRKRASSTLSDLLDELLRNWLRTHNVEIE